MMDRDWNDPQYKKWRIAVFKRDRFKCKRCGSRAKLQAHHIRSWADAPDIRFVLSNGITLCKKCHDQIKGQEEGWAAICTALINTNTFINIKLQLRKLKNGDD